MLWLWVSEIYYVVLRFSRPFGIDYTLCHRLTGPKQYIPSRSLSARSWRSWHVWAHSACYANSAPATLWYQDPVLLLPSSWEKQSASLRLPKFPPVLWFQSAPALHSNTLCAEVRPAAAARSNRGTTGALIEVPGVAGTSCHLQWHLHSLSLTAWENPELLDLFSTSVTHISIHTCLWQFWLLLVNFPFRLGLLLFLCLIEGLTV